MRAGRRTLSWRAAALGAVVVLAGCAGGPPPPDWQSNARSAIDAAVASYLVGDARGEALHFARARAEVVRTGRADWVARVELMRCAARVASVVFEPCEGFEALRADAAPAERAYADYLAGRMPAPAQRELLPAAQRAVAGGSATLATVQAIEDPLSRLIAIGVLFQGVQASPALLDEAVDTASAQGWRRPLLAWLQVQSLRAEQAGDAEAAQRLRRRMALVQGPAASAPAR